MEDHSSNLFPTSSSSCLLEGFDMGIKRERFHVAKKPRTAAERFLSEENCDRMMMKKKKKSEKKVKRPRFAFQTRSSVDILDDGYRWRKYGQKAVKNNKFPRYTHTHTYISIREMHIACLALHKVPRETSGNIPLSTNPRRHPLSAY
ncbi:hypothetical protein SASPL_103352 [Salvia splendens]|uniref:WRKY domain-containing protein n=1 Tax=Salvia splendens TaxID=180675 RepID=A0A8X8YY73_SALSN|nr:hypothetical protein SASPL_103352 [Salvia splendens]